MAGLYIPAGPDALPGAGCCGDRTVYAGGNRRDVSSGTRHEQYGGSGIRKHAGESVRLSGVHVPDHLFLGDGYGYDGDEVADQVLGDHRVLRGEDVDRDSAGIVGGTSYFLTIR